MTGPTTPRLLPLRVAPAPDEAFASFVDRLAARLELPLLITMKATGLTTRDHFTTLPSGYGIAMASRPLARFCSAAGVTESRVRAMLVSSYDGIAVDFSDVRPEDPSTIRRAAVREWFYAAGSHVCPDCIAENRSWRLAWKLPFSFACARHLLNLASTCPACGGRTGAGRRDGRTAPVLPSLVPQPGLCQNPLPIGEAVPGRRVICGYPLEALERHELTEWPTIVDAQREIDRRLDGRDAGALGFFQRLRSLTALLLAVADRGYLQALPYAAEIAWDEFEQERQDAHAERRRVIARGADGRKGPRTRYWQGAPLNAALMTAVVPRAIAIGYALDSGDAAKVGASLAEPMRLARARDSGSAAQLARWFQFPPDLAAAWRDAFDRTTPRFVPREDHLLQDADIRVIALEPRHVPRLLPEDLYREALADCFDGVVAVEIARVFCSIAIVRLISAETWNEAGTALGIPVERTANLTNHVVYRLRQGNGAKDFWQALKHACRRLAEDPDPVDYRRREARFAAWDAISQDDWSALCLSAGIGVGKPRGRRRCASAFVWGELTGRPWHEAPAYSGRAGESEREVYRLFERHLLPRLRGSLIAFAERLATKAR